MKKNTRNSTIELSRIFLMLGICLLHCITQGGHVCRGLDNLLLSCVTGFVFISGYFGLSFKISKIIRLITMAFSSVVVLAIVKVIFVGGQEFDIYRLVIVPIVDGYWFLWAYVVMMCFAPLVDVVVDNCGNNSLKKLLPLFFCAFGWSYLSFIPYIKDFIPKPNGFGALTFLSLVGVYAFARVHKVIHFDSYLRRGMKIFILFICAAFMFVGFGHYCSPFSVIFVMIVFSYINKLRIAKWCEKIVVLISPSVFAIYLLHANGFGYTIIRRLEDSLVASGVYIYGTYFLVSLVIFAGSLILDLPRRIVIHCIKDKLNLILGYIDKQYDKLFSIIK